MGNLIEQPNNQLSKEQLSAEFDIQISTAKKYPRNVELALGEASMMVTFSKEIAEKCTYCLTRKQNNGPPKNIVGPSIRLAEIFAQCWGNLHAATRTYPTTDNKTILAEAVVWDLEKNVRVATQVRRSILTKKGYPFSIDMQTVTANAAASIALRNAILRVIPRAYADNLHKIAADYAVSAGEADKAEVLVAKTNSAFEYFIHAGYSEQHILAFLNRQAKEEITREDLMILGGIKNRIVDGFLDQTKSLPIEDADFEQETTNEAKEFFGE